VVSSDLGISCTASHYLRPEGAIYETGETGENVVVTAPFWSYRRL